MAKINKEKYEEILVGGQEFKSNAERKRQVKQAEETLAEQTNAFLDELTKQFEDALSVGDYVKIGDRVKLTKKVKDDKEVIEIKVK